MNFYISLIGFQLYIQGFNTELGNLALNKPTLSSSVYYVKSNTSNSVDGNRESDWYLGFCFASEEGDFTPWLMVDLQGFFKISSVLLVNRGDCCAERLKDFTVETLLQNPSDSPTAVASSCLLYSGSPGLGETVTLDCEEAVIGRYVRVRNSGDVMTVCEIEVYGEPTVPHSELGNLALNKPTLSSSVYYVKSNTSNSVDGNRESDWYLGFCFASEEGDFTPWLMVDLQGFFKISSVLLVIRGDCCAERLKDFTVETLLQNPSDSPTAVASSCLLYSGSPGLGETVTLDCEEAVIGRYVRVRNSGDVMTVCEIEVYGEPTVPHCSAFHGTVNDRMQSNQSLSLQNPVLCANVCADAFSCLAFNFRWSDLECEIVTGTFAASDQANGWIFFERNIC